MEKEINEINKKIFDLLDEKGMTQKELSELTGISTSAISDWKHKGANPSAANVQKICKVLGENPEKLLGRNNYNSTSGDIIIQKDNEMYQFVELCNGLDADMRKRILTYAMAMIKVEKEQK